MKILFIGDVVGSPGREALKALVPEIKKEQGVEFVVANAENIAGGSGIVPRMAEQLFDDGVDVLTSGDHIWKKKEIFEIIDRDPRILRPLNLPEGVPGRGWNIFTAASAVKVAVINLVGRVFMEPLFECPFKAAQKAIDEISLQAKIILVDIHAEATSEKIALGWHLDGRASAVLGTHTHVQTADEKILTQGTAFICDAGMTGPLDSVIGREKSQVLARFLTSMPSRFEVAKDDVRLQGVVVDVDEATGKSRSIVRIQRKLPSS